MNNQAPLQVGQWLEQAGAQLASHDLFYGHGTDNPGSEAQWLVTTVLSRSGVAEVTEQTPIPGDLQRTLDALLARRIRDRVPMAYLLGEAWFAGHCFYVDERVLVPRSPIAELIENRFEPLLDREPATILDLCCGSGCIGIACALAFPDSQVVLADISADALAVADINIDRFGLSGRVRSLQSDLLADIPGKFDLIVCNPPYVPEAEYRALPQEYFREPALGLVTPREGLDAPLKILAAAGSHLEPDGALVLETGYTWPALQAAEPTLSFLWIDFAFGGEGVCFLRAPQLRQHYPQTP